ncbi:MAG: ribose-5-phosphate isomerase RpiA [Nitriliruptoraceae bacterium]|jgi:ribose 5-phosphate isomerase A
MSDAGKRAAGRAAAELVEPGMRLGYGTGSTVEHFLVALAERGLDVAGVPTSEGTARRCTELGLALLRPDEVAELDLAVDGADELTRDLALTKGGGGALLREKVVATMARRFVVIATPGKVVPRLGDSFPMPVEVIPFAAAPVRRALEAAGFVVDGRNHGDGRDVETDNGNVLLDARLVGGVEDPAAVEAWVEMLPGVVACGLFTDLAHEALLGDEDGTVASLRLE